MLKQRYNRVCDKVYSVQDQNEKIAAYLWMKKEGVDEHIVGVTNVQKLDPDEWDAIRICVSEQDTQMLPCFKYVSEFCIFYSVNKI